MPHKLDSPSFLKSWLQDLSEEIDEGRYKIIPFWILSFVAVGLIVSLYMPKEFWTQRRDNATVVYAAILTMNGIILALSWGAFAKIYETISAPNFSTFLKEHGALDKFLFFVAYVHLAQLLALIASAGGLIITQFDTIGLFWQRIALATTIGLGSYAVKQAAGSVTVMHDLIRYRTIFDADARANQGNVAGFEPGRRPR
jgi:hypothetical protein